MPAKLETGQANTSRLHLVAHPLSEILHDTLVCPRPDIQWIGGTANIGSSMWSTEMAPSQGAKISHSTSEWPEGSERSEGLSVSCGVVPSPM